MRRRPTLAAASLFADLPVRLLELSFAALSPARGLTSALPSPPRGLAGAGAHATAAAGVGAAESGSAPAVAAARTAAGEGLSWLVDGMDIEGAEEK